MTEDKKHRGFHLFGHKKEQGNSDASLPLPEPSPNRDSAYASSDHASSRMSRDNTNNVPVENHGQFEGIDPSRKIEVDPAAGSVIDSETGEQVQTIKTVTTTVTTISGGRAVKTQVETHPAEQAPSPVEPESNATSRRNEGAQNHVNTVQPAMASNEVSELAADDSTRPRQRPDVSESTAMSTQPQSPNVPVRNPNRLSQDLGSPRPTQQEAIASPRHDAPRPNFSRPARPTGTVADPQAVHHESTASNLKAAVTGIIGVGQTLQGTLGKEIDSRFPAKDPRVAAAIDARHQEMINKGLRHLPETYRPSGYAAPSDPGNGAAPVSPVDPAYTPANRPNPAHARSYTQAQSSEAASVASAAPAYANTQTPHHPQNQSSVGKIFKKALK